MQAIRLEERLQGRMGQALDQKKHLLGLYAERLQGLSPLQKLSQGFAHVADGEGRAVLDVNRVKPGDLLTVHVKNGRLEAEVKRVYPADENRDAPVSHRAFQSG